MFDAKLEKDGIVKFIQDYYKDFNLGGAVIGISGGKDSAVVAGLFTEALGKDNVLGVTLPCHSNVEDRNDAKLIADHFGFKLLNVDLTEVNDVFKEEINKLGDFTEEETKNSDINLKPRIRMATMYYLAALYSNIKGKTYIVAGTSNKCEHFVGYFTKGGDGVSDINVLADLTVDEVIQIGEVLNVPKEVLYKTPNDGLSGLTDEEKLGLKYSDISKFLNNEYVDIVTKQKIMYKHLENYHKYKTPVYMKIERR